MQNQSIKTKITIGALFFVLALILPAAVTATVTVTVVSTNDFHGSLNGRVHSWSHGDVVGGADYLTGYINIVRQENPNGVLWLDAGDAIHGTLISNYFYGASIIEAYNAAGITAMTVGDHEFNWGQDVLQDRCDQADFPFLAANVFYAKKHGNPNHGHGGRPHWVKPYKIFEANGIKVGVIGIANPETSIVTSPINNSDLIFIDPVEAVNNVLPKVEAKGATLIVVLAHIGGFWPDFEAGIKALACGLDADEVDLIVSGHTHSRIDDILCDIPVVQAYSGGTAFSRVDFNIDTATGEAVDYNMNYSPVSTYQTYYGDPASYKRWDTGAWQEVIPDPAVTAVMEYYNTLIDEVRNEVIGNTTAPITRNYRYESAMGDWVTDIMKNSDAGIDFAISNSGGLRADIDAGDVTFGEVFESLPFDNTNVIVELTGTELIQVLEEGITGDHGVIQVSGLSFTFDYDAPADSRIVGDVIDLSTGSPLVSTKTYYVATNDFMAAGGDGYDTLAGAPRVNTYVLVRDLVVDWVKANSQFSPPDPASEQRITALGTPPS